MTLRNQASHLSTASAEIDVPMADIRQIPTLVIGMLSGKAFPVTSRWLSRPSDVVGQRDLFVRLSR